MNPNFEKKSPGVVTHNSQAFSTISTVQGRLSISSFGVYDDFLLDIKHNFWTPCLVLDSCQLRHETSDLWHVTRNKKNFWNVQGAEAYFSTDNLTCQTKKSVLLLKTPFRSFVLIIIKFLNPTISQLFFTSVPAHEQIWFAPLFYFPFQLNCMNEKNVHKHK